MRKNLLLTVSVLILLSGCSANPELRLRQGEYFGKLTTINYANYQNLGKHRFKGGMLEKNGMIYTCKGGYIDIGHVRESADRTAYIQRITYDAIMKGQTELSFRAIEPAKYYLKINYPDNWNSMAQKERIAKEVSIGLGHYIGHTSTIWHEMITWFGFSSTGFFSEQLSSFSWDDVYSDLLGTNLAARSLRDNQREFDDAMTILLNEELKKLGARPPKVAKAATEKIRGQWFTGDHYFFADLTKRNFDIGLDDGVITPWLVPNICPGSRPISYPVPTLDFLAGYGFSVKLELEPKEMEKGKILRIVYPSGGHKRIEPRLHFPVIMEYIKTMAVKKYGPEVDVPNLRSRNNKSFIITGGGSATFSAPPGRRASSL